MTSTTLPYAGSTHRVTFWRGPFARATYREIGHTVTSLPVAVAGFVFAVTMFALGLSTLVVWIGLPVLVGALAGARALGGAERGRARSLLGLDVAAPAAPAAGLRARVMDAAGWKALLFHTVMFPWRVLSFVVSVTFLVTGWVVALFPAYSWVFHRYLDWPGYRVYDFTTDAGVHHAYYIESPAQIAAVSAIGLLLVLVTPKLVRGLTNVDRAAIRSLLSAPAK
ncbi:sensor domain-containing protein [Streptomyces kunmingensis]|uniref:Sensor domain-containing protein n=1 Tax=Streptomyces kunmingensis TaxID=68225 RepID=A0ABU6C3C9_9ACTN|nr:sensor domain-containing protein [Streptomyces kunmingensis]MEB3959215.1 sensor domain-containing protein [Streptomyces kunmingensis]